MVSVQALDLRSVWPASHRKAELYSCTTVAVEEEAHHRDYSVDGPEDVASSSGGLRREQDPRQDDVCSALHEETRGHRVGCVFGVDLVLDSERDDVG